MAATRNAIGRNVSEMTVGRQINFYLSNGDQEELAMRLDSKGGIVAIMPPLPNTEIHGQAVTQFARWNSGDYDPILFRPSDSRELVLRRSGSEMGYMIDLFRSPAIEFSRCITKNDIIIRGRVYYIAGFIDDDYSKITKPPEFVSWAANIFKIVKKLGVERRSGDYIGKEAQSLEKLGYKLVGQ